MLLDTQQAVSRALFRPRVVEVLGDDVGELALEASDVGWSFAGEELLALLDEAVRAGRLRFSDARLIALTRLTDVAPNAIAAAARRKPQTVRQRRRRAERVLADWVRAQDAA